MFSGFDDGSSDDELTVVEGDDVKPPKTLAVGVGLTTVSEENGTRTRTVEELPPLEQCTIRGEAASVHTISEEAIGGTAARCPLSEGSVTSGTPAVYVVSNSSATHNGRNLGHPVAEGSVTTNGAASGFSPPGSADEKSLTVGYIKEKEAQLPECATFTVAEE